jgi:hypothetical protein
MIPGTPIKGKPRISEAARLGIQTAFKVACTPPAAAARAEALATSARSLAQDSDSEIRVFVLRQCLDLIT